MSSSRQRSSSGMLARSGTSTVVWAPEGPSAAHWKGSFAIDSTPPGVWMLLERPRLAAVDGEARAPDPVGLGRDEEGGHPAHLLGPAEPSRGDLLLDKGLDPSGTAFRPPSPGPAGEEEAPGRQALAPDPLGAH